MAVKYLDNDWPDGTVLGQDTSAVIGFFGTTSNGQPSNVVSVTTTGASSTTNAFGYTTSAQANAIVTAVNALIANAEALGLAADS